MFKPQKRLLNGIFIAKVDSKALEIQHPSLRPNRKIQILTVNKCVIFLHRIYVRMDSWEDDLIQV